MMIVRLVAVLTAGLFSGAAIYINLVEHPARMSCGTGLAVKQWRPSYHRATIMQVPLAIVSLLSSLAVWYFDHVRLFLVSGLLIGSVIPFTLLVILPTNKKLEQPGIENDVDQTSQLLARWNHLHLVRTILSLCSFAVMLFAILK